ncbi:MAG: phosphomannomutase/phosphoglucomutase [Acutalibacteraceae bacterium]|nr:phosphomannomutase/phosphoglucomutase [Acutalibacteraceae bacterium]
MDKYWSQFKSGTDIRGIASEGVEGQSVNLTDEAVTAMVKGFVKWLCDKTGKSSNTLTVAVGRDSRISGPRIMKAVENALMSHGVKVLNCGLASTPSMFMTTVDLECDGSVQITASHHPFNRNGLKFFTRDGGLESEDITALLENAENNNFASICDGGTTTETDYMSQYCEHLKDMIRKGVNSENYEKPLEGFKIVVDAGNGAGGFYANKVLAPLGADITGSQFLEPDGMFPNHVPNPEDATAMEFISKAVLDNKADLGVIFDTDVDRGGAVDSNGNEINRNRLVAVASAIALEGVTGGTIVTDSTTSSGLKTFIEEDLNGKHHRFKRGYKNVINEAIRLNKEGIDCPLAIETSGHAAMRENYFLDDGAYLCTKIIIKMAQLRKEGKDISTLTATLKEPVESREVRFKITDTDFKQTGNCIIKELEKYAEKQDGWTVADDSREGVRVSFDKNDGDGWFLLRLSVHDPIMPLNIESDSAGGVDIILDKLMVFLKGCSGLEI